MIAKLHQTLFKFKFEDNSNITNILNIICYIPLLPYTSFPNETLYY